tara:strand:+ start:18496 stop:19170 length:675 start_codon:yes stop_codon:yes gene_type:complete
MAELNESEAPQGNSDAKSAQSEEGQAVERADSPATYSEEQFKGLQSSLSRQINEANQRAQSAENVAETARQQAFQTAVANVEDPEEQTRLRMDYAQQDAAKRIAAAEAKADAATALAEGAGKHLAAQELAAKYGVPADVLQGSSSLEAMESTAKMFRDTVQREVTAKAGNEKSQESEPDNGPGAPAVDSGTGGGGAGVTDNSDIQHTGKVAEGLARARAALNSR